MKNAKQYFPRLGIAMLAFACLGAHAETYRCKAGGKVVFSDRICGANAEAINVKPASGDGPASRSYDQRISAASQREQKQEAAPRVVKRVKVAKSAGSAGYGAAPAAPPDR